MTNVVAVYGSTAAAREAMALLERKGVEGADIQLGGPAGRASHEPVTNDEQRSADQAAAKNLGRRILPTVIAFVVVLGGIGLAVAWIIAGSDAALLGLVGGAGAGLMLGFFYGGASKLPANSDLADTYAAEAGGPSGDQEAWVEVHTGDGGVDLVMETLRGTDPVDLRVE